MSAEKVPLSEVAPVCAWRRQSKAKLAPPAATDFEKKTVLLIGATGAILGEAARILADLQPATLIFGVRNVKKGEALADRLRKTRPQLDIKVWEVDFLSFDSVKRLATTINEHGRIDAIVMGTAAVQTETKITKDGWEETLQLQHLSTALLFVLILPRILADADSGRPPVVLSSISSLSIRSSARAVKLPASPEESYLGQFSRSDLVDEMQGFRYGLTKIINLCWVRELCARIPQGSGDAKVQIHAPDPGACLSPLTDSNLPSRIFLWCFGRPLEMSARVIVNSCLPIEGSHGKLFD
ncbi:short-chain dehydrogenase/reductase family protein [Apiospora kogelbergensis]|uniref:Short-chain dehydrogenase/reductase family protein n=1 Tax=Apiospora kogelbergensis TaxID=1337665 RepID=A0AAW0Q6V4_9PEZI